MGGMGLDVRRAGVRLEEGGGRKGSENKGSAKEDEVTCSRRAFMQHPIDTRIRSL